MRIAGGFGAVLAEQRVLVLSLARHPAKYSNILGCLSHVDVYIGQITVEDRVGPCTVGLMTGGASREGRRESWIAIWRELASIAGDTVDSCGYKDASLTRADGMHRHPCGLHT